jgi:hypothetical protein
VLGLGLELELVLALVIWLAIATSCFVLFVIVVPGVGSCVLDVDVASARVRCWHFFDLEEGAPGAMAMLGTFLGGADVLSLLIISWGAVVVVGAVLSFWVSLGAVVVGVVVSFLGFLEVVDDGLVLIFLDDSWGAVVVTVVVVVDVFSP